MILYTNKYVFFLIDLLEFKIIMKYLYILNEINISQF